MREAITTKLPWADEAPVGILAAVLLGERPEFRVGTSVAIADVAKRCWAGKTGERPTFSALVEELESIRLSEKVR